MSESTKPTQEQINAVRAAITTANDPSRSRQERRALCRMIAKQIGVKAKAIFQPRPNPTMHTWPIDPTKPMAPGNIKRVTLGDTWNGVPLQRAQCIRGSCLDPARRR